MPVLEIIIWRWVQGGCMAIENGSQLALTLDRTVTSAQPGQGVDIEGALKT